MIKEENILGIIGHPIEHSISPAIHSIAINHWNLPLEYKKWDLLPEQLESFLQTMKTKKSTGINVTVPYKTTVMPHLDYIDPWANLAGAVNTIRKKDDKLMGYNTDGIGFMESLEKDFELDINHKNVMVCGSGGSARAITLSITNKNLNSIAFSSRNTEKTKHLLNICKKKNIKTTSISLLNNEAARELKNFDLIINCTPVGMKNTELENKTLFMANNFTNKQYVFDLVYNPLKTELLKQAEKAGALTCDGLGMLVRQAAYSFKIWTGKDAPINKMMTKARTIL